MLTFGSLFAGIGGFDLGLERAGMTCAWQVEREPYAVRVLEKHWPNVRRHDDVCTFPPEGGNWEVDLICGGFPCQDISVAGKGAGLAGERSGLWHEMHRIISEIRPRFVIVENVAALLSRGMETVLGELSEIGYDAEWHVIPAAAVGAPHRRDRVWIVAHAIGIADAMRGNGTSCSPEVAGRGCNAGGSVSHCGPGCSQKPRQSTCDVADANSDGKPDVPLNGKKRSSKRPSGDWWETEPAVGRVVDGVPNRVDRLRGLGNAVVPQIVELIGRAIIESTGGPAGCRE